MMESDSILSRTYLTFKLHSEVFAIEIARVREVVEYAQITQVPRTPDYMRGVINLRGHMVAVVDMNLKLGLPPSVDTIDTCIVIIEGERNGEEMLIGAIADSVCEVIEFPEVAPPPEMGNSIKEEFIRGMAKANDSFTMIIDVNSVFSAWNLPPTEAGMLSEPSVLA